MISVEQEQKYSLSDFVEKTVQKDRGQGIFELESSKMLEINLDGRVWIRHGSMIAYKGSMKFEKEGMMERGLMEGFKKFMTGEVSPLAKADGKGKLYVAHFGKRISILKLENQSLNVQGNDILAFEDSIDYEIKIIKKVSHMLSGGLFYVEMKGTGLVAITTYGNPTTLKVTPTEPVRTDPNATVAWSGNLSPELKTDIGLKSFIGKGGGEAFQYEFTGDGFVVVQPYEEVYMA